jgi:large subunit ribosomal protein L24
VIFMIKSGKPRYQRRFRFNAPMHSRQHFLHAHIDKALRNRLKLTRRTVQISRGDTVKIMSGSKKGTSGKVIAVDLRSGRIQLDSLSRKSMRGKELKLRIYASNVYITDLNLSDRYRAAKLKVAPVPIQKPKPAEEKREEAPAPAAPHAHAVEKMEQKAAAGL